MPLDRRKVGPGSLAVAWRTPDEVVDNWDHALVGREADHGRHRWLADLGVDKLVVHHVEAAWRLLGGGVGKRYVLARTLVLEMTPV